MAEAAVVGGEESRWAKAAVVGEAAVIAVKQAGVVAKMGAKKAFGEFDIEKVFWQIVYGEGIFVASYAVWEIYKWIDGLQEVLSGDLTGIIPHSCKSALGIGWKLVYTCTACASPNNVFNTREECEAHLVEAPEGEAEKPNTLEDAAWMLCTNLFNKYGGVVMLGIPVLCVLMEYRNLKRRKKALKHAGLL